MRATSRLRSSEDASSSSCATSGGAGPTSRSSSSSSAICSTSGRGLRLHGHTAGQPAPLAGGQAACEAAMQLVQQRQGLQHAGRALDCTSRATSAAASSSSLGGMAGPMRGCAGACGCSCRQAGGMAAPICTAVALSGCSDTTGSAGAGGSAAPAGAAAVCCCASSAAWCCTCGAGSSGAREAWLSARPPLLGCFSGAWAAQPVGGGAARGCAGTSSKTGLSRARADRLRLLLTVTPCMPQQHCLSGAWTGSTEAEAGGQPC